MTTAERITGEDGLHLRFESSDTPMHTLKIAVLDTSRRGTPITLAELHRVLPDHLHLNPRSTQRVGRLPGSRALAWVEDQDFDLAHHLDEVTAPFPGDRAALDQVAAEVMVRHLDRRHPLWALTLVHGLEGGRQAVVLRIHHSISDGKAAINLLLAATSDAPASPRVVAPRPAPPPDGSSTGRLAAVWRSAWQQRRGLREFGPRRDLPTISRRTPFNPWTPFERRCASAQLDFADVREIARATGLTVNGVFHGIVAGTMRRELLDRGLPVDHKLVAAFGIAEGDDPGRRHGNSFATSFAYLHADVADPVERLRAAAASARRAVALREAVGFDYYRSAAEYQQHLLPLLRTAFGNISPVVGPQIALANVPGPTAHRWIGDVELVDWISQGNLMSPALVSLTGYSYAGRFTLGLTVAPKAVPDPVAFLDRFAQELASLLVAVRSRELQPQPGS